MSLDVALLITKPTEVYSANITHNLAAMELIVMTHYSQGVAGDGPCILMDGMPLTPEEIVNALNHKTRAIKRLPELPEKHAPRVFKDPITEHTDATGVGGPDGSALLVTDPTFAVVRAARAGYDRFTVEGVFSKDEDAEELRAALESSDFVLAVAKPQRVPMKTVIEMLLEDRLGELAKLLAKLAQKSVAHDEVTVAPAVGSNKRSE